MDAVRFYERWVNGRDLRTLPALFGAGPRSKPASAVPQSEVADATSIELGTAGPAVTLPPLRSENLAPISCVAVHGSQATRDACDFSDVDVLVVVEDRKTFTAEEHAAAVKELQGLLRAIYRYDPLMHHGLMFFPASGFDAYDQTFLPVETLRRACALHGPSRLAIRLIPEAKNSSSKRVLNALSVIRTRLAEHAAQRDDYSFKRMISNILLLPALLAAARGHQVYKRDSFPLARDWFSDDEWSGIRRTEEYRNLWKRTNEPILQRVLGETSHPSVRVRLSARLSSRANVSRLLEPSANAWLADLNRTFQRAEAIVA